MVFGGLTSKLPPILKLVSIKRENKQAIFREERRRELPNFLSRDDLSTKNLTIYRAECIPWAMRFFNESVSEYGGHNLQTSSLLGKEPIMGWRHWYRGMPPIRSLWSWSRSIQVLFNLGPNWKLESTMF